jgi:hypothetical protein
MQRILTALAGAALSGALFGTASAQPYPAAACCTLAAGTEARIELADPISTKTEREGDRFAIRLAEPLVVDGQIVAPAGAMGVGEVVDAAKAGMGGKAAKLILAAKYIEQDGRRIPLQGLQLAANGKDHATAANVVGVGGIGFAPLGVVAMFIRGDEVTLPPGTGGVAKVSDTVTLAPLGPAPLDTEDSQLAKNYLPVTIPLTPPPSGHGQIVFFRAKSALGTAQWFNVREEGKALGKLDNGAYFVVVVDPGEHVFTAKTEPEFKDKLKLKVDPGETYFVQGVLSKGVIIGAADLTPSNWQAFDKAAKDMKQAADPDKPAAVAVR